MDEADIAIAMARGGDTVTSVEDAAKKKRRSGGPSNTTEKTRADVLQDEFDANARELMLLSETFLALPDAAQYDEEPIAKLSQTLQKQFKLVKDLTCDAAGKLGPHHARIDCIAA